MEPLPYEPKKLTSVNLAIKDLQWIKENDVKLANVIKAGIIHIEEGSKVAFLNEKITRLEIELGRAKAHKDIIYWIFKNYPEIYLLAKKSTE